MKKTALILAVLVLTGCASSTKNAVKSDASQAAQKIGADQQAFRQSLIAAEANRVAAQEVRHPFIAGNTQPLAREVAMPDQMRRSVPITALFTRQAVDLPTALDQISEASGMLITATQDALLSPAAFGPRIGGAAVSPVQAPTRVVLKAQNTPLWSVLDDIARQVQASWRAVPGGAEFYRVETRVFPLAAIQQIASTSASLGRNGTANAVFDSQSKTSFETKAQNQLTGLILSVDAMLTQSGKATLSQENQTLIVTDTKPALDRVAAFVAEQNKIMSRRVRVMLEAIEVVDRDGSDVGVEWDILYGAVRRSVNLLSPGSTTSTQAGSMGITQNTGRYAGSSLVVKALSEVGVVVNRRFFPFLTTSGRPVTQAIRSTFNYVDQVQATSVASSINTVSQAPTVTQKDETVGTFVTIVPTAKSDGTIFISLSFDQTSAQPLVPFTVGSSGAQVTVQQKTIDGSGIIQEVPVRSGQTVIVGGIESTTSQDSVRRLFAGAPLLSGGGDTSKVTKSRMVLLVTAVAEEDI